MVGYRLAYSTSQSYFFLRDLRCREEVLQSCSVKKSLLKISQNPQKYNWARVSFLIKVVFIWKPIYWPGDIPANQYNFFHALRIKVITRFDWQYICERPFLQKVRHGNDELLKKCSYEGLNFICDNISDACSVDLLIIHEKEKIDIILLLVKQNPSIYCQC